MKQVIILLAGICMSLTGLAQSDSTEPGTDNTVRVNGVVVLKPLSDTTKPSKNDTIRVGSMIIVKKHKLYRRGCFENSPTTSEPNERRSSRLSTNWFIVDLGFANYNDQTDYKSAAIQDLNTGFAPGLGKDQFKLRTGKSVNVNIWFFMQRLGIIKNIVNLKYGLGLELNNYRYKEPIRYQTSPTRVILDLSTNYEKNKLATDYITVPLMLNFNFTPHRRRGFGFSAGASAGYLYSSRQKTITAAEGKKKVRDDFDLRPWKISYIGELGLGPVKLYGSYATQSIFERGLDQQPYNIGLRLSNW